MCFVNVFVCIGQLSLTSSGYFCSELFRIPIDTLTGRSQCFFTEDRGQGHEELQLLWMSLNVTFLIASLILSDLQSADRGWG